MRRLCPRRLGSFVQANARRLVLLFTLTLLVLCAAIKSVQIDTELSNWIQQTTRIHSELQAINAAIGDGAGSNSLLIFQTPRQITGEQSENARVLSDQQNIDTSSHDILSIESFMTHLEALGIATHVTIDLFDVSWSLKDICTSPTPPDYDGLLVNQMLEHLMPCIIKTPLDCFWEGSKLLGPEQDVRLNSIGPKLKWTNLNPSLMVEARQRAHPHASFPYESLFDWMRRVGLSTGYQMKPCLDPTDPNCPSTAPNKLSGQSPDVGAELTGGCHSIATNQMHWKEQELIGGIARNRTGHIIKAEALQSTILLMGERDMYDYWRKTSKVQDITNWSTEKARQVLEAWQKRFKSELAQFTRTSMTSSLYKIQTMTPKSLLEPIGVESVLDFTSLKLSAVLMTLFTCLFFPKFSRGNRRSTDIEENHGDKKKADFGNTENNNLSSLKTLLLALFASILSCLTLIASLGLSTFMNLPFNIATAHILPPLALYHGFKQTLFISNIYARRFKDNSIEHLTTECLSELLPTVLVESFIFLIPLLIATVIPLQATRVFVIQLMTYVVLASFTAIVVFPSLLTAFLLQVSGKTQDDRSKYTIYTAKFRIPNTHSGSSSKSFTSKSSKVAQKENFSSQEHIDSRIQEDLKNIRASSCSPSNIDFSARVDSNGLKTSFRLTTSQKSSHVLLDPAKLENPVGPMCQNNDQKLEENNLNDLPDLVLWPEISDLTSNREKLQSEESTTSDLKENLDLAVDNINIEQQNMLMSYFNGVAKNPYIQTTICCMKIVMFVALLSQIPNVQYGLQIREIILRDTPEYELFTIQEKYFPIYNVFAITRGNLDYPTNQRLLHEFYRRIERVDNVVQDDKPRFWLIYFRDWLLELQTKFDIDRNRSAISVEGWNSEASDASKLAYKLLAQTGKIDDPIDKSLVESNRLVDKNGIINQKAFYYYLTAWVMNDAFSYSNSEANFKPEPKTWNDNPDELRIERARPLIYAQIPFTMKIPANHTSFGIITEVRSISHAFEQLNLPNFPTGIPFIFWDQFFDLDLLFYASLAVSIISLYLVVGLQTSDLSATAIISLPILMTSLELFGVVGFLRIPFNSVVAVLIIGSTGTMVSQSVYFLTPLNIEDKDSLSQFVKSMQHNIRIVITNLILLSICVVIFLSSKIDFMIRYSQIIFVALILSSFNSLFLSPVLIRIFRVNHRYSQSPSETSHTRVVNSRHDRNNHSKKHTPKRRHYPKVQSEISLSTISEESHSEARDLKLDLSIRCY